MCGASTPPPHPISSSIAPGRVAVGTRAARAAAIQCSISNAPRGFHHSATRSSYWPGSLRGRMSVAAPTDTAHLRSLLAGRRPTAPAAPGQAARLGRTRHVWGRRTARTTGRSDAGTGRGQRARPRPDGPAGTACRLPSGAGRPGHSRRHGAGQLSIGWSNDYLDRERDRRTSRADKPIAAGAVSATVVGGAAVTALILDVPLCLLSGPRAAAAYLIGVVGGWAYNIRLKSTAVSVAPYVVAFGLLPAFVTLGLPGHPWPPWWALTAGALLGAGAHFANVLPDLDDDARTGVRGLPHRLGGTVSRVLAAGLLLAATVMLAFGPTDASTGGARALGAAAVGLSAAAPRVARKAARDRGRRLSA